MAHYKTYPVKVYYFYNRQGQKVWFDDKFDAWSKAYAHAQTHKVRTIEIYWMAVPRSGNAKLMIDLITGRNFSQFTVGIEDRVFWHEQKNYTHAKEDKSGPIDPYDLLGVVRDSVTRETLLAAFRAAANKFHPDKGGSTEAMTAVNAANDKIKKAMGWN